MWRVFQQWEEVEDVFIPSEQETGEKIQICEDENGRGCGGLGYTIGSYLDWYIQ